MEDFIRMDHVTFTYPATEQREAFAALRDLSLSIEKGSFVAVIGQNGSGKSTLAKLINALLLPAEGTVFVNGYDTKDEEHLWDVRQSAGMVFQNPDNQIVSSVVEDDVAFGPENLGVAPAEIRKRVDDALEAVGMAAFKKNAPHLLSGGQKQRIAIAGAIAMRPQCIVFDEPTAMLDPQGRREVVDTVYSLCRAKGMTVVYITHHMDECIDADRLIIMSSGRVMADGKPESIFANEELLRREGLEQPETARLLQDLRAAGLTLKGEPLNVEDCAELIAQSLQSERSRR